ncbi:PQQ-dependent sugar dehydrogenase [Aurantiacibacter spongiae]|uniref:Sorbosone dehydrogenase family protein n=1 Tax=Aurantiacibacter spongiae TaxID=2488860 RepID=A0A3N5DMX4_9SPHN|nr:sorbosone dehydrogenase family protein [Aurantiacibacter spongiae]RPF72255.1 sorbosone dehydrogenase family protein [Aurantiacibacter spongiae]
MKNRLLLGLASGLLVASCGSSGTFDKSSQIGADPVLPEAEQYLVPPFKVAEVVGWEEGEAPVAPAGFEVRAFASNLGGPRQMLPLDNGDVLVVETKGPGLEDPLRPKDFMMGWAMSMAHGSSGGEAPPTNQITLLRDADGNGIPEMRSVLVDDLFSPFGIAYADGTLYVANTDAIVTYPFSPGQTHITAPPHVLTQLPGGPIDHHWTKDLALGPDGTKLFASVGSNSNITENGKEAEKGRAAIWEIDRQTGAAREFATGLRNPNGLTFYPGSDTLWTVVNERDELGPNLVPDYMTSVRPGGFYGWPYSYYGQHVDRRVQPQRPDLVARAIKPDYALSSHVAPLGLTFYTGGSFPEAYEGGAFIGEHGSWDRDHFNGYKVVFVPFADDGKPNGMAQDFLTGFLTGDGSTHGRPVGVAVDRTGALLVADDAGGTVWRVTPRGRTGGGNNPAQDRS